MKQVPVIAVFDVGKTNKKLFLFDEQYRIVFEKTARFTETVDEDGDACDNIETLRDSLLEVLHEVSGDGAFDIKAVNFSAYGASLVYIDAAGKPLTPLYSYLKAYPTALSDTFYKTYGSEAVFAMQTASPVSGSLNSGMQLYRLKYEQPAIFHQLKYALHLPQYLSFLLSGIACADITSIGCHTSLWDFQKNKYHAWVAAEGLLDKMAPLLPSDSTGSVVLQGKEIVAGVGLHDSSAALIPYLVNFLEPFVLISTGTWCVSLNPFNTTALTPEEIETGCLCYMSFKGSPVKASRIFAGNEHEQQVKRIALHFDQPAGYYKTVSFDPELLTLLKEKNREDAFVVKQGNHLGESVFAQRNLAVFSSGTEAYHQLMLDISAQQYVSTKLILQDNTISRIFVDGGFSHNDIYMHILAASFPQLEVYAAAVAQATSLGAALAIHSAWNSKPIPAAIIELKHYPLNARPA